MCLTLAATACGTTEPEPTIPGSLVAVSGSALVGRVGDSVSVAVRVATTSGRPVPGQTVVFAPVGQSGSVTRPTAVTDAAGEARTTWTFGGATGVQTLTAQAGALSPLALTATVSAGRPAAVEVSAGPGQAAAAGTPVAVRPAVVVRDVAGNGVPGVRVAFTVEGGGGRVTGDTAMTDGGGVATVGAWQLGPRVGENTLAARVIAESGAPVLQALLFTAGGVPGAPARLSAAAAVQGGGVVGTLLEPGALPAVTVEDAHGNAVASAAVTFTPMGHGTAVTVPTDVEGRAAMPAFTLGTTVGVDTVVASVPGGGSLIFRFTTRADVPARTLVVSGGDQAGLAGATLPLPVTVRVVDRYGNPVAGVPVVFRPFGPYLSVADARQTTDARGLATSGAVTLGRQGGGTLLVEAAGTPIISVTSWLVPGLPSRIEWWPRSLSGPPFPVELKAGAGTGALTVRVVDEDGNVVPGVPLTLCVTPATAGVVRLAAPGSPASVCVTTTAGRADVTMQSSGVDGLAAIVASAPGLFPASQPIIVYR